MAKRILVVDDEPSITKLVSFNLEKAGYDVDTAADGQAALKKVQDIQPDLIVLDLMLPKVDGLEVCKRLRQENNHIPVIMLTAKDEELDRVLGLELGADDYVTKPFSPRELVARVKAVLRRSAIKDALEQADAKQKPLVIGDLVIDVEGYESYVQGKRLELTPKEFELLVYMATHRGTVLSRDQLLNAVWNYDFVGDSRIVDVHVSHLRDKIEPDTRRPLYIKTVRGIGYKFEGPKET
ncbi:response regulator transcription factor [Novibacillus thermophilus]|uniref:DNA-binding response regulator n=1 Tax=Novibacillus thermophilus TaxID=1471761 RepID=A0A1U9K4S4_9BACL|nr:response regulator transcription factor [Novibacillus thermophilus]AQS55034.1 DNA-binding response regulator [Novibacillus thermophilus]